jgi:hypothetical protein
MRLAKHVSVKIRKQTGYCKNRKTRELVVEVENPGKGGQDLFLFSSYFYLLFNSSTFTITHLLSIFASIVFGMSWIVFLGGLTVFWGAGLNTDQGG